MALKANLHIVKINKIFSIEDTGLLFSAKESGNSSH